MGIYIENVHKASGSTIRAFNHEGGIYQGLTLYNDYRGGGGNHSHEINILARTCSVESGKILRSLVHMQLKFFRVCNLMRPAILTHVIVWTTSFTHIHINLWCKVKVIVKGH